MNPGTLTHGHTYLYNDDLRLTFSHETINHYVFSMPDNTTLELTFSDVKIKLTEIT